MNRKELINQCMDYIMQHLDEELSLEIVADRFYMSKYHFGRIFKEETGETLYAFIKRCKIDQSAIDMKLNPARAITDIGLDYGYSSSNYSSVFRKHHDISPAMFRKSIPLESMQVPFGRERVGCHETGTMHLRYLYDGGTGLWRGTCDVDWRGQMHRISFRW